MGFQQKLGWGFEEKDAGGAQHGTQKAIEPWPGSVGGTEGEKPETS